MKKHKNSELKVLEPMLSCYQNEMNRKQFRWGVKALRRAKILTPEYLGTLSKNIETARTTGELLELLHSNNLLNEQTHQAVIENLTHTRRLLTSCRYLASKKKLDVDNFMIIFSCAVRSQVLVNYLDIFSQKGLKKSPFWVRSKFSFEINMVFVECIIRLIDADQLTPENFSKMASHNDLIALCDALSVLQKRNLLSQKNLDLIFSYPVNSYDFSMLIASLHKKSWGYDLIYQLQQLPPSNRSNLGLAISLLAHFANFEKDHVLFVASLESRKECVALAMSKLLSKKIFNSETKDFLLKVSAKAEGYRYGSNNPLDFEARHSPENQVAELWVILDSVGLLNRYNLNLLLRSADGFIGTCFSIMKSCCEQLISANILSQEKFELLSSYNDKDNHHLGAIGNALIELDKHSLLTEKNFALLISQAAHSENLWLSSSCHESYYKTQADFELLIEHAPYAKDLLNAFEYLNRVNLLENAKTQICSLGSKTKSVCLAIAHLYQNESLSKNNLDQLLIRTQVSEGFSVAISLLGWRRSVVLYDNILQKLFSRPDAALIVTFENNHYKEKGSVQQSFINIKRSARILAQGHSTVGSSIFQFPKSLLKIFAQKTALDDTLSPKETECIAEYYFK